jgi:hypothetical protein
VGGLVVVAPGVVGVVAPGVVVVVAPGVVVVVAPGVVVVVAPGVVVVVVAPGVVVVVVVVGGMGGSVSCTTQAAFQIAFPLPVQFNPGKLMDGTGGMMSPHTPLGEFGGSVFGKSGPVWLPCPAMSMEFAETVSCV